MKAKSFIKEPKCPWCNNVCSEIYEKMNLKIGRQDYIHECSNCSKVFKISTYVDMLFSTYLFESECSIHKLDLTSYEYFNLGTHEFLEKYKDRNFELNCEVCNNNFEMSQLPENYEFIKQAKKIMELKNGR